MSGYMIKDFADLKQQVDKQLKKSVGDVVKKTNNYISLLNERIRIQKQKNLLKHKQIEEQESLFLSKRKLIQQSDIFCKNFLNYFYSKIRSLREASRGRAFEVKPKAYRIKGFA